MCAQQDERYQQHKSLFLEFLDGKHSETGDDYPERVRQMVEEGRCRLIVSLDDFIAFDRNRQHISRLMSQPHRYIAAFQDALKAYVDSVPALESAREEYFVGFSGSFGPNRVSPRQLRASLILSLLCVEGVVTKMSPVRPKLVQSVHYCPATKKHTVKYHRDSTALFGLPTAPAYPKTDEFGNVLQTEFGLCVFKDFQTLHVQEMPERAPPGQLPRSVEVIVENDLVDLVKPGDRVRVMGVYRALANAFTTQKTKGIFQTLIVANNIQVIGKDAQGPVITAEDVQNIKSLAKDPNVFEILSRSIAPSVYGYSYIKKGILMQLLGGAEQDLKSTGIRIRGDINILMVGDPGTAKSQLLRFVMHAAPLCISTSGRGASGVGLTAAVVQDRETSERRLEAGAMVLADRGIVCIDEFDKMTPDDRVAIHEAMEQQTVTISKAGIHASLNARCSVLAAANPIYGKYDKNKTATQNIALPDSLLSRFDLLFIVLDLLDPMHDRNVAEHVVRMHRYRQGDDGESDELRGDPAGVGEPGPSSRPADDARTIPEEEGDEQPKTSPIYVPCTSYYAPSSGPRDKICTISFIKKYILYAKLRAQPVLTQEAQARIVEAYDELRRKEDTKTLAVTARMLETAIRLSVAHARCRLSNDVTLDDVDSALEIMRYALYNDAGQNSSAPTLRTEAGDSANDVQRSGTSEPPPASQRDVERALSNLFRQKDQCSVAEVSSALLQDGAVSRADLDARVRSALENMENDGKLMFLNEDCVMKM
ncbi:uncharacterized protein LOC126327206 [Schistocerca gregaria]|uniref:uncharacterized protein LOC126327206 n=1 Tax=Schistocerca gregaria TaxID=7010 RepID=UPI00211F3740|nr:uncharacterized protein LOC126327206 [Schistocerca gregaria]